ncbi:uncharacterized protein BXIN_0984 [Babesia sp. Xinjiang]|uniref:uncharacterized protein n=1 Tax=Babesia sp. Xinjiang TaxID=462227 RepID=UPI000A2386F6|nr:uncharacterized protein BXIN_0984 [Babesia sp. Xinjiang]ORM42230.1 hypothetical protein BXIN_0984 [Babesia sp. Xinjiang]
MDAAHVHRRQKKFWIIIACGLLAVFSVICLIVVLALGTGEDVKGPTYPLEVFDAKGGRKITEVPPQEFYKTVTANIGFMTTDACIADEQYAKALEEIKDSVAIMVDRVQVPSEEDEEAGQDEQSKQVAPGKLDTAQQGTSGQAKASVPVQPAKDSKETPPKEAGGKVVNPLPSIPMEPQTAAKSPVVNVDDKKKNGVLEGSDIASPTEDVTTGGKTSESSKKTEGPKQLDGIVEDKNKTQKPVGEAEPAAQGTLVTPESKTSPESLTEPESPTEPSSLVKEDKKLQAPGEQIKPATSTQETKQEVSPSVGVTPETQAGKGEVPPVIESDLGKSEAVVVHGSPSDETLEEAFDKLDKEKEQASLRGAVGPEGSTTGSRNQGDLPEVATQSLDASVELALTEAGQNGKQ